MGEEGTLCPGNDQQIGLFRYGRIRREDQRVDGIALVFKRGPELPITPGLLNILAAGLAMPFEKVNGFLVGTRDFDDAVGQVFFCCFVDEIGLVSVAQHNGRQGSDLESLGQVRSLVGVDDPRGNFVRIILIAAQQFAQLRVRAGLDKGVNFQFFIQLAEHIFRLWRQAIDIGLSQVEAVMMTGRQIIHQDEDTDKEQRIDRGAGSVFGRALTKKGFDRPSGRDEGTNDRHETGQGMHEDIGGKMASQKIGHSGKQQQNDPDHSVKRTKTRHSTTSSAAIQPNAGSKIRTAGSDWRSTPNPGCR